MNIIKNYVTVLRNYKTFTGRTGRAEYWQFLLVDIIIFLILAELDDFFQTKVIFEDGLIVFSYFLITTVPVLALGYRRVHDVGHSGWHSLIPLYNLFLFIKKGNTMPNRFGEVTKTK